MNAFTNYEETNKQLHADLCAACKIANSLYAKHDSYQGAQWDRKAQNLRHVLVDRGALPQSSL